MKTAYLVQDSKEKVRITYFEKGDVYKRLIPATTYSPAKIQLGVVTDVMHNGSVAVVSAMEILSGGVENVIYSSTDKSETEFFPAEPSEIEAVVGETLESLNMKVDSAEVALHEARSKRSAFERVNDSLIKVGLNRANTQLAHEIEAQAGEGTLEVEE